MKYRLLRSVSYTSWIKSLGWSISLLLSWGIISNVAQAEDAATIPAEINEILTQIETAANNKDLEGVMTHYSPEFTNTDGLTSASLSEALTQIWRNYPRLQYATEIKSWERTGNELMVETVTQIRGTSPTQGRSIKLNTTINSRQYFQDQKLVRQEILSEQTQLTSGANPPKVEVIAPATVKVGEKYNFDVVVTEPLKDSVLLGGAVEEKISSDRYLNPSSLELEALPAGGLYKIVTAPNLPDNHWLSAILVRGDGITMVVKRISVK